MKYCFEIDFLFLTTLTLISSCFHAGTAQQLTINHNEFCSIRPTLVAVDHPFYRAFPYYVTLQRCGGSVDYISPRYMTCIPATFQEVKIEVRNLQTSELEVVTEKNHTSCTRECTDKPEMCDPEMETWNEPVCRCECKYPDEPPEPCPARFKWNSYTCECECNEEKHAEQCVREKKVWSNDKCGCECPPKVISRCKRINKVLDESTCRCVVGEVVFGAQTNDDKRAGVAKPIVFGVVVGEFFLLLLIFDVVLYMKKWGFIYYLRKAAGKAVSKGKESSAPLSPTSNHDTTTYL